VRTGRLPESGIVSIRSLKTRGCSRPDPIGLYRGFSERIVVAVGCRTGLRRTGAPSRSPGRRPLARLGQCNLTSLLRWVCVVVVGRHDNAIRPFSTLFSRSPTLIEARACQSFRPDGAQPRIQRENRYCRGLPSWTAPNGRSLALSGTTAGDHSPSM